MPLPEIEVVDQAFEAWNARDYDALAALCSPNVEAHSAIARTEGPGGLSGARRRAGVATEQRSTLDLIVEPEQALVFRGFLLYLFGAEGDKPWAEERLPLVKDRIRDRLAQLCARLGDADWLDGAFSAGDLMMVSVLLRLRASGLLDEFPKLPAYVARGEARPAYKRAFAAQLAINAPDPQAG